MKAFVVAYDLSQPKRDYPKIEKALEAYGTYNHLQGSVWIIKSSLTAEAIRDYLCKAVDKDDEVFVCRLSDEWASYGLEKKSSDWLTQQIR